MRVLCIDANYKQERLYAPWAIKEGEVYEVIKIHQRKGIDYYELSHQPEIAYWNGHFIPCSEIDETELVNERLETA